MKTIAILFGAAALLAGCASAPPDRFYTLDSGGATPAPAPATAAPLYIEVLPVTIPAQVRRSQLVVSEGEGRVDLLEHHRWAGPLADEIGRALSLDLSAGLGALDVYRTPTPAGGAPYRIGTTVQRFESAPGAYALLDATWSVRKTGSDAVLACRSVFREPVGAGYEALVAGHRVALGKLAGAIAAAVQRQEAGGGGC
jgi:uncharacterized lipoprotein YmbA